MDLYTGPPPGLSRPKTSPPPPPGISLAFPPSPSHLGVVSPVPRRATAAPWASSLAAGLFPATFPSFPVPPQVPHGLLPSNAAVQPVVGLHNNSRIIDLGTGLPAPTFLDPWHCTHARVCVHATTPCAACSIALFCCTCHALRFTPGPPPASPPASTGVARLSRSPRSHSASPALFRLDVGNGPPPPGFDSHCDGHDDDAYANTLAESDTCDNSSCPCGTDEPAAYTITVEQFDEGSEETYDRTFRACSACNRSCKRSFMGHRIKARIFDNSVRDALASKTRAENPELKSPTAIPSRSGVSPTPNVNESPLEVVNDLQSPMEAQSSALHTTTLQDVPRSDVGPTPLEVVTALQESLHTLNNRPPTPALFVANVLTKH
ncbi:hypothetical protein AX14_007691, partial [Amanita brunnescens Koide BX004]